jgi:hypothetical protein
MADKATATNKDLWNSLRLINKMMLHYDTMTRQAHGAQ